jgi:Na+/melibiose symporter-like transporter
MVWATYGAPNSLLLILFLQEWLHADKWQIGLVMTMTFLGPTFEPLGAYLVERLGRRRTFFIATFLLNRTAFLAFALLPFLSNPVSGRALGIALVLLIVGLTRVPAHLGTPAWWSWMADLVPERRHSRWFGCRNQAASAVTAISFILAMVLLEKCGGMENRCLVSALFGVGAFFGIVDILLYIGVSEPQLRRPSPSRTTWRAFKKPFRQPGFRRLILGMGLWSFSANLVIPFLPGYQRGEVLGGHSVGLHLSWLSLAVLNVSGSLAGMATSRRWGLCSTRLGPRWLLILGSGYLFVNLTYLCVGPGPHVGLLVAVALVSGALNAAWTVTANQLLVGVAPRENRSIYVSAHNFTNGWLMAGGPLLGGWLADRMPVLGWNLPSGLACCYFHLLLVLAACGGATALLLLAGVPSPRPAAAQPRAIPASWRLLGFRIRATGLPNRWRHAPPVAANGHHLVKSGP